ncbi:CsgG/HfaB family protein [bacterium]|nr:CsgG/HfaB family protein [bacterium]
MKRFQKIYTLLFAILLFSAVWAPAYSQNGENVELKQAKQYFNNGKFLNSIDILKKLVVTKTLAKEDYRDACEYLAMAYVSTNQESDAKKIFTEIITKDPNYRPSDKWWPHNRLMKVFYNTAKELQGSLQLKSPGIKTIAIIDFENNSIEEAEKYDNLGNALSKILIGDFAVLSNLKVVERERLQFLLDELELTDKTVGGKKVVDASYAPRLGKLLGAHSFVFGSFMQIGKTFRLDARLVKTETGEIFKTASVEGKPDKIIELAKKLTIKITNNLDVEIKKAEHDKLEKMGQGDIPLEALALYGNAMAKLNNELYKDASVILEEAVAMAPEFRQAHDLLATIRPHTL